MKEGQYEGYWWLPKKPNLRICGTLRLGRTATLDLLGSFALPKQPNLVEIIMGISSDGKRMTLHRCLQTEEGFSSGGVRTSSFLVLVVFIGVHFRRGQDVRFKNVSVVFGHVDEWVGISGIGVSYPRPSTTLVRYKPPRDTHARLKNCTISLLFTMAESHSITPREVKLRQQVVFEIETKVEMPFRTQLDLLYRLENFMALAIGEPAYPMAIEGTTKAHKLILPKGKVVHPSIQIIYPHIMRRQPRSRILQEHMLFKFVDVRRRFQGIMRNWFEGFEDLRPVYDLYFGTLYNPQMYLQQKFLSLAQAIESYHRRKATRQYELPQSKHKAIEKAIQNACPPRHRSWLKRKLTHSNELSLPQRLHFLLSKYPFLQMGNRGSFVTKVVDTRNYLAHYDKRMQKRAATIEEMTQLCQKLRALLEAVMLGELGFDQPKIRELMERVESGRTVLATFVF